MLSDVSFRIEPGQVAAIVGPSGTGKSTIVSLIPRFYDPDSGDVRIDGTDVRDFTLKSLRDQISFVLQDTLLFRATVWENIAYGRPDASPEETMRAAELANAHEFIVEMPQGYATMVGERGVTLSGGQRQRIAIARAIVRNAPILILDEPTTGLDAASEQAVIDALGSPDEGPDVGGDRASSGHDPTRRCDLRGQGFGSRRAGHARRAAREGRSLRRAAPASNQGRCGELRARCKMNGARPLSAPLKRCPTKGRRCVDTRSSLSYSVLQN